MGAPKGVRFPYEKCVGEWRKGTYHCRTHTIGFVLSTLAGEKKL